MIRVEFRTTRGEGNLATAFYLVFVRSEHKGNARDVQSNIFISPKKVLIILCNFSEIRQQI